MAVRGLGEQADKWRLHASPLPPLQRDSRDGPVVTGTVSCSPVGLTGTSGERSISRVPHGGENWRFYSRYFLVPKKTGGIRPILSLSLFNKSIMVRPFHMLTRECWNVCARKITACLWNLKDTYFHIPSIPKQRQFLCFLFQVMRYQCNCVPFGFSLAPQTFSKCAETALQPLKISWTLWLLLDSEKWKPQDSLD